MLLGPKISIPADLRVRQRPRHDPRMPHIIRKPAFSAGRRLPSS
jgi:hypothetical protein